MNVAILIGNLTRDPELSYTPNTQTAICRFTIAVDRPRRANGEDGGADYPRIVVWGRQAEACNAHLSTGRKVAVRGRLETGSYKNKDGVTVYTTDVIAEHVEFLSSGNGAKGQSNAAYGDQNQSYSAPQQAPASMQSPAPQSQMGFDDLPDSFQAAEDDIPF